MQQKWAEELLKDLSNDIWFIYVGYMASEILAENRKL